uniref:ribonuclease H n=1 Tax=Acrobeloides nanus TaxID=290746 RepID=A0A914DYD1_9BILA
MPRQALSYSLPLLSNNSATLLVSDPHVDGIEAETNPVIEASETPVQPGKNYMKDDPLYKAFLAENTEEKMDPWKDVPTVSLASFMMNSQLEDGKFGGRVCAFWGENDPHNICDVIKFPERPTRIHLNLEGLCVLLRQAINEKKLTKIKVQTDDDFLTKVINQWLRKWKTNGYRKVDGTPVKNQPQMEDLGRLTELIEVRMEVLYGIKKNITEKLNNEDLKLDLENENFLVAKTHSTVDFTDAVTIYAAGVMSEKVSEKGLKFKFAGYGVYCPTDSSFSERGRFENFPSAFRTQIWAIHRALQTAIENGLSKVHIVTDSGFFVAFFNSNWKKNNKTHCANFEMYTKLLDLTEKIPAKFTYFYNPDKETKKNLNTAIGYAEDGLSFPTAKDQEKAKQKESLKAKHGGTGKEMVSKTTKKYNKKNELKLHEEFHED